VISLCLSILGDDIYVVSSAPTYKNVVIRPELASLNYGSIPCQTT
jgi:hypothetical protein